MKSSLGFMSISRLPTLEMHWSVNNANFADVSLFFHECSVFTSKLDPNYNLVYKFNTYLFIYFILLHCQFARPRVLFIFICEY